MVMGRQMYFYYLEWLYVYNQFKVLLFLNNQNAMLGYLANNQSLELVIC